MLSKKIIKSALLGLLCSIDDKSFESSLIKDDLPVEHLEMLQRIIIEHKQKLDNFSEIINKIKSKKNE